MLLFEFIWSMFGQFNLTESHDEDDDEGQLSIMLPLNTGTACVYECVCILLLVYLSGDGELDDDRKESMITHLLAQLLLAPRATSHSTVT